MMINKFTTINKVITIVFILGVGLVSSVQADDATAQQEINYLIQAVSDSGCDFERNGRRHSAEEAADHLRLKYRRGRKYADSAEHFIDRLASKSSFTGKAYNIICSESETYTSKSWLHQRLKQYRQQASTE